MKRSTIALVSIAVVMLAAGAAQAGLYAASASTSNDITVGGSWTVNNYLSNGCYSGLGSPEVNDWKSQGLSGTPVNLSTSKTDATGTASSSIKVTSAPKIEIDSAGSVHDVLNPSGHWAMGYSEGGSNWLTSGQTGTVTVTCDYSYALDTSQAKDPDAYAKIYVAFWGPGSNLLLGEKDGFVQSGNYLVKTIEKKSCGSWSEDPVTTWDVSVTNGGAYSFWGQADAMALTTPEPATLALLAAGGVMALIRRKRSK